MDCASTYAALDADAGVEAPYLGATSAAPCRAPQSVGCHPQCRQHTIDAYARRRPVAAGADPADSVGQRGFSTTTMDADVAKKCVLVTGGSRGIGLEVVRCLLTGTEVIPASRVVSLSRSIPAELEALAQEHPSDLVIVQGDVTDETDTVKARDAALERWGRLDALVLNAGIADLVSCANLVRARHSHRRRTASCMC